MMRINSETGLLEGVRYIASPNCDARPEGVAVDVLVIHCISLPPGEFGGQGIEQLFCNSLDTDKHPCYNEIKDLTVSSHFLLRRDGEIVQFVPLHKRAWHAGQSEYKGRSCVNDFSVGIELEGAEDVPFEAVQYEKLAELTRAIMNSCPAVTPGRIVGHADVAPGRKTDPGPFFDWKLYLASLQASSKLA